MSFTGKVVLITGASSGIGAATAIGFARDGANVVIVGRNESKLNNVSDSCAKLGNKPLMIIADISKDEDAKLIIDKTIEKFGKLDILVNNAGLTKFGTLLDGNILAAYDGIMSVNVRAHINMTSLAAQHLKVTKGNIINVSSVAGKCLSPVASMSMYYVSKAAMDHFTRCAALELSTVGVRVNSVSPGIVQTDLLENAGVYHLKFEETANSFPLQRISQPSEVSDIIMYLASDKAIGITGSDFVVDNGHLIKGQ
ncbi:3-oxoacyl-[acyl-carrier-protein] reductase FabG-like [Leptidea sinapis]|uniref:Uncharacterized protein n=1 Tax=Leptidea sinapis TaxID=189913 RepID=A0A5E4QF35_9NEOP|nr:3-oxoacyl-[acyl-carrier-protein] reductase FabG-like [Leptidea sinapis]VVC96899.1 unnamed protein product [Leptidea sinapis]